jgi:hypothetical protein
MSISGFMIRTLRTPGWGRHPPGWRIYVPAARAISTLERRPVFCRMCETWVCRPW